MSKFITCREFLHLGRRAPFIWVGVSQTLFLVVVLHLNSHWWFLVMAHVGNPCWLGLPRITPRKTYKNQIYTDRMSFCRKWVSNSFGLSATSRRTVRLLLSVCWPGAMIHRNSGGKLEFREVRVINRLASCGNSRTAGIAPAQPQISHERTEWPDWWTEAEERFLTDSLNWFLPPPLLEELFEMSQDDT